MMMTMETVMILLGVAVTLRAEIHLIVTDPLFLTEGEGEVEIQEEEEEAILTEEETNLTLLKATYPMEIS